MSTCYPVVDPLILALAIVGGVTVAVLGAGLFVIVILKISGMLKKR